MFTKISNVLSILSDPTIKKARKIKSGDYGIINDGKRRLLYLRRGQSWIPVDKSYGKIETCYNYDQLFLNLEYVKKLAKGFHQIDFFFLKIYLTPHM